MIRPGRRAALAVVVGIAAGVAAREVRGEMGDPFRGQSLFVEKGCVQCHAVRGSGGRIGPDLGRTAVKGSFFELAAGMWNHAGVWRARCEEAQITRPSFQEDELGDLIAFLYFLNYFDEPGDPRVGKVLFAQKHCIQCHRIGREGGTAGPPLDRLPRGTAPLRIAQDLWNHGPVMVPAIRRTGMDVPKFEGSEIVDLFAYLRSQGPRQAAREFRSAGDPERGRGSLRQGLLPAATPSSAAVLRSVRTWGRRSCAAASPSWPAGCGTTGRPWPRRWGRWAWRRRNSARRRWRISSPISFSPATADGRATWRAARRSTGRRAAPRATGTAERATSAPPWASSLRAAQGTIAQLMWNHAPQMGEKMSAYGVPWPSFEADEMANLFAFLEAGLQSAPAEDRGSAARCRNTRTAAERRRFPNRARRKDP